MLVRLRSFLDAAIRRQRFEAAMVEEMETHQNACAADLVRQGLPPEEARRQARIRFGRMASVREQCREARGLRVADEFRQDVRGGWRQLLATPFASATALATIAAATGLVLVSAALVHGVLLRPPPFDPRSRLVEVDPTPAAFEALELRRFRQQQTSFQVVHGYYRRRVSLTSGSDVPESLRVTFVTGGLLDMLGIPPLLGRTFREGEAFRPDGDVMIIGETTWRGRFGADPAIIGRRVDIDGRRREIVGVMPAAIRFPVDEDVWLPMDFALPTAADPGSGRSFNVIARLRDGIGVEAAEAEARLLVSQLWDARDPGSTARARRRLVPFAERYLRAGFPSLLLVTLLAAAAVLLVACFNVANLMLVRAASRADDLAVRAALGAGRVRIARQFATESLVLAGPGTLAGLCLAALGLAAFERYRAVLALPHWMALRLDAPILVAATLLTLVVALSASVLPVLRASPVHAMAATRGRFSRPSRATSWLLAGQVAGSCACLIAAGLLVRSNLNLARVNLGFDPSRVVIGRLSLPPATYPDPSGTMMRLLARIAERPAVESASLVRLAPGTGPAFRWAFAVDGEVYGAERPHPRANGLPTTHGHFETMGIPVLDGRDFTALESRHGTEPVLIVNRTLARRYLGERPLGRRIRVGDPAQGPWLPVVGVVGDTYVGSASGGIGLESAPMPQIYLSWGAAPYRAATLVVRAEHSPRDLLAAVQRTLSEVAPGVALDGGSALSASIGESTWAIRLFGWAFTIFGGVALLICAGGLFSVSAFAVRQRTREIGVRMALGAGRLAVARLVTRRVAGALPLGLLLGLAASIPLGRSLRLLLLDVPAGDVSVHAMVVLTLGTVAAVASWGPAVTATRIDPATTLRAE